MIELNGRATLARDTIAVPRENKLLDAALRYADLGYAIFPCIPNGKKPAIQARQRDASDDPEQIETWWNNQPLANIGLLTSGLLVIDIDGADNPWPPQPLPAGAVAETPSGGRHHYFRRPNGNFRNTVGKIATKVDTRSDGGYIVAPPSVIGDKSYRWAETLELQDAPDDLPTPPDWVLSLLTKPKPRNEHTGQGGGKIREGGRNAHLTSLAGAMRRHGVDQDIISNALRAENEDRCAPPLEAAEVRRVAKSISRYEPAPRGTTDDAPRCKITTLANVEPVDVEYLWPDRIPLGMFAVLAGNPGLGKSTVALDIASRVSRGVPFPGCEAIPNPVGDTILILGEDPAQIVRKRVDGANGDPSRIHILEGVRRPQEEDFSEVRLDIDATRLDEILQERPEVRLVVIDPLDAFLGEVESHNKAETVSVLKKLATLAEDRNIAVLGILHLRKAQSATATYRVMGSVGFVSAPRAVWAISRDKTDRDLRLMTVIKFNIGREPTGLSFTIEGCGVVAWGTEPVLASSDELLSESRPPAKTAGTAASQWLLEALAVGPMDSADLRQAAEAAGHSWRTVGRVKSEVGVVARKCATGWQWRLDVEELPRTPKE